MCVYYNRDRTAVIYGQNILSFRAIFNDVRNSIDHVHHTVRISFLFFEKEKKSTAVFSLPNIQGSIETHCV